MSFFQKLSQGFNDVAKELEKAGKDLSGKAEQKWQDVQVKCPTCQMMLTVPPPPAPVFQCGQCGTQINRPNTVATVTHHAEKIGDQLNSALNQALNQQRTMQVQVPQGVKAGDTIMVQAATPGAPPVSVAIPPGAQPGQTITVQVPANAVPAAPRAAAVQTTPATVPVAAPIGQGGSGASGYSQGGPSASGNSPDCVLVSGAPMSPAPLSGAPAVTVVQGIPVSGGTNEKS